MLTVAAHYQVDRLLHLVLEGVGRVLRIAKPDKALRLVCAVERSLPEACVPDWGSEALILLRRGMVTPDCSRGVVWACDTRYPGPGHVCQTQVTASDDVFDSLSKKTLVGVFKDLRL